MFPGRVATNAAAEGAASRAFVAMAFLVAISSCLRAVSLASASPRASLIAEDCVVVAEVVDNVVADESSFRRSRNFGSDEGLVVVCEAASAATDARRKKSFILQRVESTCDNLIQQIRHKAKVTQKFFKATLKQRITVNAFE